MNIYQRLYKVMQSCVHAFISKFEDPVKMAEQGIRDLKHDFDENMKSVAQVKAIAIGAQKEKEEKSRIAKDYQDKAVMLLKKAKNGELSQEEADRLATEALKKQKQLLTEIKSLNEDINKYDSMLSDMEQKTSELKTQIKKWEAEYQSLKARATVAKTTKKINQQLSAMSSDSTVSMLEDMKNKIQEEENLAEAYSQTNLLENSVDDEINKAIGCDSDVKNMLDSMKQQLLTDSTSENYVPGIEEMKKELDS